MNSLLARLLALCVAVGITAGAVCSWVGSEGSQSGAKC